MSLELCRSTTLEVGRQVIEEGHETARTMIEAADLLDEPKNDLLTLIGELKGRMK